MKTHIWAKLAGWGQFALIALNQFTGQVQASGAPHGWASWLTVLASLAGAVGIHAASNTAGTGSTGS